MVMPLWQRVLLSSVVTACVVVGYHLLQRPAPEITISLECREAAAVKWIERQTGRKLEKQNGQAFAPSC